MAQIDGNGITIEYEVRGEGDPILFVMGLAGQLSDWPDDFIDLFVKAGYQAIVFDNRDIGLSSQSHWTPPTQTRIIRSLVTRRPLQDVGHTLTDMADDAVALLNGLNIHRAHVIGISMGGMIAQEMAIEHPDRVRSLCSIMSNTGDRRTGNPSPRLIAKFGRPKPPSRDTAADETVRVFEAISGPHFDEERLREMVSTSVARSFTPAGVARQQAAIAGSRDRTDLLEKVLAPSLVIHGLVDPLVRPDGGVTTANAITASRLVMFPDMGHDLPRPRWEEMRDLMIANAERAA